ncbi:hypothetical protein NFI96_030152 [Prochilodus magdalenae]|nr:hypothetical protein NFI96_030152 [Prochilodus magdalenae]
MDSPACSVPCVPLLFRYSLGDQLRAGFFGQDACVQTDVSELPLVRCLSDKTAQLVKEMEMLRKEITVKVKFIEAHYESRLQQEAEAFYTRINLKVKAFENHHKEKISVLRNSYRQQFADAVEVIKASYKNYILKKGEVVEVSPGDAGQVQDLLNELREKDFKIKCLNEQLRENEEQALLEISSEPADYPEKDWLRMENDRLKDDVNSLHVEMEQIRQALEAKDQSLKDMVCLVPSHVVVPALNISQLQSKEEDSRKVLQKLAGENERLKEQLNLEKENGRMQDAPSSYQKCLLCVLLDKYGSICQVKGGMPTESETKPLALESNWWVAANVHYIDSEMLQLNQKTEKETDSLENSRQNEGLDQRCEDQRLAEQERERELIAQEAKLNTLKAQRAAALVESVLNAKELVSNNKDLTEELEKLRQAERAQKEHIDRLQRKIAVTNQAWEKKFEVLRQSFHAIKDEMFLRQSLQRQAAALHQASVNYTEYLRFVLQNSPVSHHWQNPEEASFKRASFPTKTPLPSIGARGMQTVRLKRLDIHLPSAQADSISTAGSYQLHQSYLEEEREQEQ